MANILNLYAEKLVHIIKQTLQKMHQNPQTYTFALQTLSQNQFKFFVKDCLYDTLYTQGMLNSMDESQFSERLDVVKSIKQPLFDSVSILKERFVQSDYVQRMGYQQRMLIISLINDMS